MRPLYDSHPKSMGQHTERTYTKGTRSSKINSNGEKRGENTTVRKRIRMGTCKSRLVEWVRAVCARLGGKVVVVLESLTY